MNGRGKVPDDLPPLVLVEWDDAWSDSTSVQGDGRYYDQPYIKYEVGFLKPAKNGRVVVARTWSAGVGGEHHTFSDCVSIPRAIVKHITHLEVQPGR